MNRSSRTAILASAFVLLTLFSACSRHRLLVAAILSKNVDRVRELLAVGAPINERYGELQYSPLMASGMVGSREITQLLVDRGADVNARDANGETALHFAARAGDCSTIVILVRNGAEIDSRAAWR